MSPTRKSSTDQKSNGTSARHRRVTIDLPEGITDAMGRVVDAWETHFAKFNLEPPNEVKERLVRMTLGYDPDLTTTPGMEHVMVAAVSRLMLRYASEMLSSTSDEVHVEAYEETKDEILDTLQCDACRSGEHHHG